ncbi:MAG: hypothetical protein DRR08_23960 [Candidatus Parabeggiatoa sp. nov. 2]|nr:MAG: hypothetical protein DRR08_23960 [Gammaproteobacteria bacterium]
MAYHQKMKNEIFGPKEILFLEEIGFLFWQASFQIFRFGLVQDRSSPRTTQPTASESLSTYQGTISSCFFSRPPPPNAFSAEQRLDSCQTTTAKLKFGRHKPSILPVKTRLTDYYRFSDNYLVPFRGLSLSGWLF